MAPCNSFTAGFLWLSNLFHHKGAVHNVECFVSSRSASRENSGAVKDAQAARQRIEAAEASVTAVEEEIENLSVQEQETSEKLR